MILKQYYLGCLAHASYLVGDDEPIVLIAERGREEEATVPIGCIDFDWVAGFLDGGMEALEARPVPGTSGGAYNGWTAEREALE